MHAQITLLYHLPHISRNTVFLCHPCPWVVIGAMVCQHIVPPHTTVNSPHYCQVLNQLPHHIREKGHKLKNNWVLHQENGARIIRDFLKSRKITAMEHALCSADLARAISSYSHYSKKYYVVNSSWHSKTWSMPYTHLWIGCRQKNFVKQFWRNGVRESMVVCVLIVDTYKKEKFYDKSDKQKILIKFLTWMWRS